MPNRWYYTHDGEKFGPFSSVQMKALAAAGSILITDMVWLNDGITGVIAARVEHLFAPILASPPTIVETVAVIAPEPLIPETVAVVAPVPAVVVPPEPAPRVDHRNNHPHEVRKKRAMAITGAKIVGQDDKTVRFFKICTECGHQDSSRSALPIMVGPMKTNFYCPKCRRRREVLLRGSQS